MLVLIALLTVLAGAPAADDIISGGPCTTPPATTATP
jgi:hypothetical protein